MQIVSELVGSGKFVKQNTLVAGYYSRTARLTELPKVIANVFKQVVVRLLNNMGYSLFSPYDTIELRINS